ncbi:putative glucose-6-phosphate 1-epimerase [Carex rostrata]
MAPSRNLFPNQYQLLMILIDDTLWESKGLDYLPAIFFKRASTVAIHLHPLLRQGFVSILIGTNPSDEDSKIWPHSFEYRLRVEVGPGGILTLTSGIRNTNSDGKSFSFTFAYHTYFSISDISEVRVEGLETLDYHDNLQERTRLTVQVDAITFEGELDRLYLEAPRKIAILDHEKNQTFVVIKDGLPDAGLILIPIYFLFTLISYLL